MLSTILPYVGFTNFTPSLPAFYWDVYSAEQRIKHICYELCKLAKYDEYLAEQLQLDRETIDQILADFEKFKEGGYEEYYEAQIQAWLEAHMEDIISNAIKMVFFGLTRDGYFVAYIPDSWSEIWFDTGAVYSLPSYGCLMLKWDGEHGGVTDDESMIEQLAIRVGNVETETDELETQVGEIAETVSGYDTDIEQIKDTLYTNLSEGGE